MFSKFAGFSSLGFDFLRALALAGQNRRHEK
jgi:hypothetical protein